jgi:hypothetical protein
VNPGWRPQSGKAVLLFASLMLFCCVALASDEVEVTNLQPTQNAQACFRLFPTVNIWTFIKLDTRTGLAWQVQFDANGSDRFSNVLNSETLAPAASQCGRFTFYPTRNIFNFLLVDQETGRVWQIQWSQKQEERHKWLIP